MVIIQIGHEAIKIGWGGWFLVFWFTFMIIGMTKARDDGK